ncbi:MAG TPA: NAD(P)H-dependent oxidoreductase subunit E [Bacteroidales bacterium]|jgi:NADH-quinone oxidoreductase E subunit|nr:NAD(P)H-dependent oxidoreductase subunit E [Bacteroidales bacterium]HNV94945.1 NAD(P)H-dependent oxidoreductase subunit E [Bacteroidales bacterium]HOU98471.1 NAD(P)H-dependent oxidoreductase subunit E [Bacteroidales bacterium]
MQNNWNLERANEILATFPPNRSELIKALHALQDKHPQYYLPDEVLDLVAKHFKLTKAQVYGVVSYYSMFSTKPRGKYIVRVCQSPVCHSMGSETLFDFIEKEWDLKPGNTTPDGKITLEKTECLGRCGKAPSMMVNETVYTDLSPEKLKEIWSNLT